jgi:alpha-1,6-mannosyltransferase
VTPHLVDTTLFYTPTSGGVRRYLLAKHEWLRRRTRWQHTLLVPGATDRGRVGEVVEFASPAVHAGYRCPVRLASFRATLAALHPDVVEAADPYIVGWQAARVADELGIASIAFCHSELIGLARGRIGPMGAGMAAAYLRALYGRYTRVLAPSRIVAERLGDAGIDPVAVQALGVDAATFTPGRRDESLRTRLDLGPETRLLVFAGRLSAEKNLHRLYAMVGQLGAPYHLLVVGGDAAARPTPRITLLPYESSARRLATLLASADALVHAGLQETFGLIALEAMACGTPVVAYDGTALAEVVDDEVGLLAQRQQPDSLAAAVHALFDGDLAARRSAARRRVLGQYTWDSVFTRQLRLYESLLTSRPGAATNTLFYA